jgi:hypothetical protein
VSYVDLPPAFYAAQQWNSAYHPGGRGWWHQNVPGWGENPNNSWSHMQAANGLGADAAPPAAVAPPFSFVGQWPFSYYIGQNNAPWGRFPNGPSYASPKPSNCPGCVGAGIRPGVGSIVDAARAINAGDMDAAVAAMKRSGTAGLGTGCGPCEITSGGQCLPCPNGSDLPECGGCVDGVQTAKAPWYEHPLVGPIALGVATAVGISVATAFLKKRGVPVA